MLARACRNFTRVTRGPELGAYYHPLFQRDRPGTTNTTVLAAFERGVIRILLFLTSC